MARITRLKLAPLTVDVANATVDVNVDVSFSRSDKDANTPYTMICTLVGDDSVADFAEDLVDDVIPHGTLTVPGGQTVRADSLDVQSFHFNKTLALEDLNEDFFGGSNPDEIRARVVLTPVIAHATEANSNIRTLTIV